MHRVIVIVGPTAVGKTKLALFLAKSFHTDIISGDSIAVYKDLDIGSAKPSKEEQAEVLHHLIDIVEPGSDYSVADFQKDARQILDSKELSIICGGTGLYIQAALFRYEFHAKKRNPFMEEQYNHLSNQELYDLLKSLDPNLDESKIHPNNRKRVLRAIEVLVETKASIHSFNRKEEALYDYFIVYLTMDRKLLYERISLRVDEMIRQGLEAEVWALKERGIYPKGIGYKEWIPYFEHCCSKEEVIEEIKKNTRHLAKRQETWFKHQMESHFYCVDPNDPTAMFETIQKDIKRWLEK